MSFMYDAPLEVRVGLAHMVAKVLSAGGARFKTMSFLSYSESRGGGEGEIILEALGSQ